MPVKRNRLWTYGSSTLVASLFFLGILVFVALIVQRHPWRMDLSESGEYSLSEQTRNILASLNTPITIKAFYATGSPEELKGKDLLDIYQYASKQIHTEFIDPDRQPELAKKYDIRTYGTLVLEGYGKQQTVQSADEESITNALLKLSRTKEKKVYFLVGHGERSLEDTGKEGYSDVRAALQKENYTVSDLNLMQQATVPDDAATVVVAGPKKPLFPQEIDSLKAYLQAGGKLVVFLDPEEDAGLKALVAKYGITAGDDMVIDKLSRVFGGSYLMPVVMQYGTHRITDGFNVATFFPEARSIEPAKEPPKGVEVETLASTSENAWAERDLDALKNGGQANFDSAKDLPGPVPLAVIAKIDTASAKPEAAKPEEGGKAETPDAKAAELLVVGDSDFATNSYLGLSGNSDLFLNMVNFMAEDENLITIGKREKAGQPLLLTQGQGQMLFWTVLIFVPLLVLLSGLFVYRVRRKQR